MTALAIMGLLPENVSVELPAARLFFDGEDLTTASASTAERYSRQRYFDDLSGADDFAQPGLHRRRADCRGTAPAPGSRQAGGLEQGDRSAGRGAYTQPAIERQGLPPPDVRRAAPAGDDRDRACLPTEDSDCRRANNCARRYRASADFRSDARSRSRKPVPRLS